MAKSMRSKSKRAFRRHKREEGIYAAVHAARLERLSAKLVAKVTADKDGDQAMQEEEEEERIEEEGGCGGEDNRNNIEGLCELMALTTLDGGVEGGDTEIESSVVFVFFLASLSPSHDGDAKMPDFCQFLSPAADNDTEMGYLCQFMNQLSLVDIGVTVLGSEHNAGIELCQLMTRFSLVVDVIEGFCTLLSQLSVDDLCQWYNSIFLWCLKVAKEETYEDKDGASLGYETEPELIIPEQLFTNHFGEWPEDN